LIHNKCIIRNFMAGFFGIGDFTKEGKGVDKNAPKKRGVFAFFELFFRKFWKLMKLNLLYLIVNIPTFVIMFFVAGIVSSVFVNSVSPLIAQFSGTTLENAMASSEYMKNIALVDMISRIYVTLLFTVLWGMGPVTCGFTYVLRNYSREEHAWLFSDFLQHTKSNFKQSFIVFIIDVAVFILFVFAFNFYGTQSNALYAFKYVIICLAFVYTLAHFYLYPLMVTFDLSLKDLYRNSFLFALAKLPRNLLTLVLVLCVHMGIPFMSIYSGGAFAIYLLIFVCLELLLLISTTGFIINFNVYPVMKEYMLSKADPERYGDNDSDDSDSVFNDERMI